MKNLSILTLIALVSVFLFACGGGGGSNSSSDDIDTGPYFTGDADVIEEPSVNLIESDIAQVSCGENDYTEGGSLRVSCLDANGESTIDIYIRCDIGYLYLQGGDSDGYYEDTCIKVCCLDNGSTYELNPCDSSS